MKRLWPLATALLGVATLVILAAFSALPDVRVAYPHGDFATALNSFQNAVTVSDLDAVFGAPADPAKLAAMTAGNSLDLYGFIPAYSLFLLAGAMMLAGGVKSPLGLVALALLGIGTGADIVETTRQLRMTTDWANAASLLPIAPWRMAKYFGLAGNALAIGVICLRRAPRRWILGVTGLLPILAVSCDALRLLPTPALMSAVFGLYWIALLIVGVLETVRAKGASA